MKQVFALLFLLFASQAHCDAFENWERDPNYQKIQKLCVVGDPVLSLVKLQGEFGKDDLLGLKTGLLSSIGKGSPTQVDPQVSKQWESTPFYLGLLDCLGNTNEGIFLTKAFMTELILGYSTSQAVGWGAPQLLGLKLFSAVLGVGITGLGNFASEFSSIAELMESHPELLPRLQVIVKWAIQLGLVARVIPQEIESYKKVKSDALAKAQREEEQNPVELDPSSYEPPNEQDFETEHAKNLVQNLEQKRKTCTNSASCHEIDETIAELQKIAN